MIAVYFVYRGCELSVEDLYRRGRRYEYSNGVNVRALVALGAGIAVALVGLVVPALRWLYDYAWFVGFLVAGVVYLALMRGEAVAPAAPSYSPSVSAADPRSYETNRIATK